MLSSSFCFIETSQTPIVSLIEAPGPDHWQPHLVNGIQDCTEGPDCSLLHGGEADVEFIASMSQCLSAALHLLVARQAQVGIVPAAEAVLSALSPDQLVGGHGYRQGDAAETEAR